MANSQGTVRLYGISNTIVNANVVSTDLDESAANQAAVLDEQGNVIGRHYDDLTKTGSITVTYNASYSIPAGDGSATLAWNGVTYEITSVGRSEEQQGHRRVTLNILKSANVTSA